MYPDRFIAGLVRFRRRVVLWPIACVALAAVAGLVYGGTCGFDGCPSVAEIRRYVPTQGRRVDLARIPEHVRNAFVAVEDRRFKRHSGIDWRAFGRALVRNTASLGVREGASTLSMQVARSAFIAGDECGDRSLGRKLVELRLASRIESALSKDKILELYLNLIYLGEGTYGVEAASRHYFGKSVNRLTLAEAATLAGLPKAPAVYNPLSHPDRATDRRNLVLALMVEEGFISAEAAQRAMSQSLPGVNASARTSNRRMRGASSAHATVERGSAAYSIQQCSGDPVRVRQLVKPRWAGM